MKAWLSVSGLMFLLAFVLIAVLTLSLGGEEEAVTVSESAPVKQEQSLERGRQLAEQQCNACHGSHVSPLVGTYPKLHGQKYDYLVKQLSDFKQDHRKDLYMEKQIQLVSQEDIQSVALYFSQQDPLPNPSAQ